MTPFASFRNIPACFRLLAVAPFVLFAGPSALGEEQPFSLTAGPVAGGQIPLTWSMKAGKVYNIQRSATLDGGWPSVFVPEIPTIAMADGPITIPMTLSGPQRFYRVAESASPYDPAWASVEPLRTINISATSTFAQLRDAIQALVPGDRLLLQAGTYTLTGKLSIRLQGTAEAPIRIEAAPGAAVLVNRTDASQNILDIGDGSPARFLAIRGIEFSGGSVGMRLVDCANVWIDGCDIHDTESSAIAANTASTSRLHITRNELSETGDTAEGVYLGGTGGIISTDSIIALNHIHDTHPTAGSGAAIFIRQGSGRNLVAGNHIHDVGGPGIFLFGAGAVGINTVEANRCYRTGDNGISVLADCMVRNNLVITGPDGSNAFRSNPAAGFSPVRMTVLNNTFISASSDAARLTDWGAGTDMIFMNNACYSQSGMAINTNSVMSTLFLGNVGQGTVSPGVVGYQTGNGLADFVNVTWNAVQTDARPSVGSALLGAANGSVIPIVDIGSFRRTAPHTTGCFRR